MSKKPDLKPISKKGAEEWQSKFRDNINAMCNTVKSSMGQKAH